MNNNVTSACNFLELSLLWNTDFFYEDVLRVGQNKVDV
jgi:hypothetical protein